MTVRNTGTRPTDEVVQLYASDPVAQLVRPVAQLIGFARVPLAPGEAREVTFDVPSDAFSFTGLAGHRIVEPGTITLATGASVGTLSLRAEIQLVGETVALGSARRLTTQTRIAPPAAEPAKEHPR